MEKADDVEHHQTHGCCDRRHQSEDPSTTLIQKERQKHHCTRTSRLRASSGMPRTHDTLCLTSPPFDTLQQYSGSLKADLRSRLVDSVRNWTPPPGPDNQCYSLKAVLSEDDIRDQCLQVLEGIRPTAEVLLGCSGRHETLAVHSDTSMARTTITDALSASSNPMAKTAFQFQLSSAT